MSVDRSVADLAAEREIDLRRWLDALLSRWWIAAAGLIAGLVVGAVYALGGGTSYVATALIARGQAFSPSGNSTVLSYLSSPGAIEVYATSPAALKAAAAKAGIPAAELRGQVQTSTVGLNGQAQANTNSVLIQISVQLPNAKHAEAVANALAGLIKNQTTSNYVKQSFQIYRQRLVNYAARLKTLQARINTLNNVLAQSSGLAPLDRLVIVSELDAAQAAQGSILDSQTTTEQALTLAQDVEQTQIVQLAKGAKKSTARSRGTSVVVGAVVGLIVGALVALVAGLRAVRGKPA